MPEFQTISKDLEEFTNILTTYGVESEEVKEYIKNHIANKALFERVIAVQKNLLSGKLALKENDLANAREMIRNRKK